MFAPENECGTFGKIYTNFQEVREKVNNRAEIKYIFIKCLV